MTEFGGLAVADRYCADYFVLVIYLTLASLPVMGIVIFTGVQNKTKLSDKLTFYTYSDRSDKYFVVITDR